MARFEIGAVRVGARAAKRVASGHPWVYRDELHALEPGAGYCVRVADPKRRFLGLASWSPESKIALRMLQGAEGGEDLGDREAWFAERIGEAIERRKGLDAQTNAMRLVHAEADGLPGLVVDRYADALVLQVGTVFLDAHLDLIVPALVRASGATLVVGRNDARVRELEGLPRRVEIYEGERRERVRFHEHGLELSAELLTGQKTGYFLDQRPGRALVERLAAGRRVLDLFCYTGGFALHAARGGACRVLAADSSRAALAELGDAARRNGLGVVEPRHAKVTPLLRELAASGERFDGIVVDPPAFAKRRADLERARRGYVELNRRALALLAPGGWCLSSTCSAQVDAGLFELCLREAAGRAGGRFVSRGRLAPALDHPVLLGLPESDYLKCFRLERLDPGKPQRQNDSDMP